jgi:predicted Zn-dependent protease
MRYRATKSTLVATLLSLPLASCATNPVTGESELALVSEEQEIAMGRQADEQVVASMGLVQDEALQSYVSDLGQRLAAQSERPNLPWTFRVVDDPTVNAFALPGGFVYMTRGMLSHLTSEAQLVGILGHEIGHITARHAVNQVSRAQLAQLGLGVGMVLAPEELQPLGQVAGAGLQLLFLKFSRDDERQSDELGVEYMAEAGYDPAALAGVFQMLARVSDEAGGGVPTWASTHPDPADRHERILSLAEEHPSAERIARAEYLTTMEGLTFGPDPRQGFFRDGVFHHPELGFRFEVPSGWQGVNTRQAVQAVSENQRAAIVLTLAEQSSPRGALSAFEEQQGVQVTGAAERSVNGVPALWAEFSATTDRGELRGTIMFPELEGRVFAVYGYSTASSWSSFASPVERSLSSFRPETDPSVLDVQAQRLQIVQVPGQMKLEEFVQRYPSVVPEPTVALINQVEQGDVIPEGLAKRVITG